MNVENGLTCSDAIIDDQAVALRIEAFFIGDLLRSKEQLAYEHPVSLGHAMDFRNVPLRDHQRVHGRLRVDVLERDDRFVLEHNFRRDLFFYNLAEDAIRIGTHFVLSLAREKLR